MQNNTAYAIVDIRDNNIITYQGSLFLTKQQALSTKEKLLKLYAESTKARMNNFLQIKEYMITPK